MPNNTPNEPLLKILYKVLNQGVDMASEISALEPWDLLTPEQAKAQLIHLIEEIIGEDTPYKPSHRDSDTLKNGKIASRNALRAEQRAKLKGLGD